MRSMAAIFWAFLCVSCAPVALGGDLSQATSETGLVETEVTLADARINESSGLIRSIRYPDIFWTLNDSGGEPCIFALDTAGRTRAKVRLRDAVNLDWEDIAIGPGVDGQPRLFIADIGDNLGMRPSIQIYEIPEPEVPSLKEEHPAETWSDTPRILHAAYPDHPYNAEGIAVHPSTGEILIFTKSDTGLTHIFAFPQSSPHETTAVLKLVTQITFPSEARLGKRPRDNTMATAADISPDGRHLLIATYSHIYEWTLGKGNDLATDLAATPVKIAPKVTHQMEAVCYARDAETLWFTSEQLPAPMIRIQRHR